MDGVGLGERLVASGRPQNNDGGGTGCCPGDSRETQYTRHYLNASTIWIHSHSLAWTRRHMTTSDCPWWWRWCITLPHSLKLYMLIITINYSSPCPEAGSTDIYAFIMKHTAKIMANSMLLIVWNGSIIYGSSIKTGTIRLPNDVSEIC